MGSIQWRLQRKENGHWVTIAYFDKHSDAINDCHRMNASAGVYSSLVTKYRVLWCHRETMEQAPAIKQVSNAYTRM